MRACSLPLSAASRHEVVETAIHLGCFDRCKVVLSESGAGFDPTMSGLPTVIASIAPRVFPLTNSSCHRLTRFSLQ